MRTDLLALFIGILLGNPASRKSMLQLGEKANEIISKKIKELSDNLVKEKKDDA